MALAPGLENAIASGDPDAIDRAFQTLASTANNPELALAWERARRAFFQVAAGGRPGRDDRNAIEIARQLYQSGRVPTMNAGFLHVARLRYPNDNPNSTAERLRRKFSLSEKTSTNQV